MSSGKVRLVEAFLVAQKTFSFCGENMNNTLWGVCPRCKQIKPVRNGLMFIHSVIVDQKFKAEFDTDFIPDCNGVGEPPLRGIIKPLGQINMANVPMAHEWTLEMVDGKWIAVECLDGVPVTEKQPQPWPELVHPQFSIVDRLNSTRN